MEQNRTSTVLPHHSELAGGPIETLEIVINLIANTRTETGLEVHAYLDEKHYPDKVKVSDDQLREVKIVRNSFHGEWNYEIHPRK